MFKRLDAVEIMDLGPNYYSQEEYWECLDQLDQIGRYLGGDRATLKGFKHFNPQTIVDVGCGGGKFTERLSLRFPYSKVTGIDLSSDAISYTKPTENLSFEVGTLDGKKSYDIVTSTLVCHHMTDQQLIQFLKDAYSVAKQGIILNDLHRHPLAWLSFFAVSRCFFRNRLVMHDGLISIRRSFVRKDWFEYLQKAGIPREMCSLKWCFPFRWIVVVKK